MLDPVIKAGLDSIISQITDKAFKGKRILVTGGAGFLGSWLCDVFVKLKAEVACLDNLSTGRMENIKHLVASKNFSFVKVDAVSYTHLTLPTKA